MQRPFSNSLADWRVWTVTLYIAAAFFWSLPAEMIPGTAYITTMAKPLFHFFHLKQDWKMFAPNPRATDFYIEVTYLNRDGSRGRVVLNKMDELPYFERCRRERSRKFFNDYFRLDVHENLWLPYAQFEFRRLRSQGLDPVEIGLVRNWRDAVIPVSPELLPSSNQRPWHTETFFTFRAYEGRPAESAPTHGDTT